MGYIESNLMNGESIIYRAKLSKIIFIFPVITLLILTIIAGIIWDVAAAITGFFFLLLIVIIPVEISSYIRYRSSEFGITNNRVLIKVGLIRRNSHETMLSKIEGIQVDQGILGRLFNYGSIIIKGTGGTSNPFKQIDAPLEFRKKVQEQISLK